MKVVVAFCAILTLAIAPSTTFAQQQEFTTAQVLAKLDEKAKAFSSLEAPITMTHVVYGSMDPVQSGKIVIKMVNAAPRILLDITAPKAEQQTYLIKDGTVTAYYRSTNSYRQGKVDPKSDYLQLLLIGFGVPSSTFTKSYKPQAKGREAMDGVQTVVLELTSISTLTARFGKITLWLDPQTWTPVQTRVEERSMDYKNFRYSNVKLNKKVSDSVFSLRIPAGATKQ